MWKFPITFPVLILLLYYGQLNQMRYYPDKVRFRIKDLYYLYAQDNF